MRVKIASYLHLEVSYNLEYKPVNHDSRYGENAHSVCCTLHLSDRHGDQLFEPRALMTSSM